MADLNVSAAARYFDEQEAGAEAACARAATAHGLTAEQAEACDDGDQGCPTCPWRRPVSDPGPVAVLRVYDINVEDGTERRYDAHAISGAHHLPPGRYSLIVRPEHLPAGALLYRQGEGNAGVPPTDGAKHGN